MCGIAGVINADRRPVGERMLKLMSHGIKHRRPDEVGFYDGDGVALACQRLATIDVAGGQQPVCHDDKSVVAVFNGELFDFQQQ